MLAGGLNDGSREIMAAVRREFESNEWFDWGDGSGSDWQTSPMADHRFSEAGTYTITLHARDSHGLQSENPASVTIVIEEPDIVSSDGSILLVAIIVALFILVLIVLVITRYRD